MISKVPFCAEKLSPALPRDRSRCRAFPNTPRQKTQSASCSLTRPFPGVMSVSAPLSSSPPATGIIIHTVCGFCAGSSMCSEKRAARISFSVVRPMRISVNCLLERHAPESPRLTAGTFSITCYAFIFPGQNGAASSDLTALSAVGPDDNRTSTRDAPQTPWRPGRPGPSCRASAHPPDAGADSHR